MRYGIIDVGSNSVRLLLSDEQERIYKLSAITGLAKGMDKTGALVGKNAEETIAAVSFFKNKATADGANKIFAFATSAVRTAKNSEEFVKRVAEVCGVNLEVVSEETEAALGYLGALCFRDGGIIDIGGGSTEIQVVGGGEIIYAKSIPVGAVRLTDACGQDERMLDELCDIQVEKFGSIPKAEFVAIGGTATTAAAMILGLENYDAKKIEGFVLDKDALFSLKEKICKTSVSERRKMKGLQIGREEIIGSGLAFLCAIYDKTGIKSAKISDKDNLEGYLLRKIYEQKG